MQFYARTKRPIAINIVSLIDILTILLIFFIVTTTFKKIEPQVQIKLPESATAEKNESSREPTVIYATKDNRVFVDDKEVKFPDLAETLKRKKSLTLKPQFVLKADTDISLGFFVKVMDAAKLAGIDNLSLSTEEPRKPNP